MVEAERLLVAVGRAPVTDGLGLAAAGLAVDQRGFVPPAAWSRLEAAVPGIHLVGPHVSEMIAESQLIVAWDAEPSDVAQ